MVRAWWRQRRRRDSDKTEWSRFPQSSRMLEALTERKGERRSHNRMAFCFCLYFHRHVCHSKKNAICWVSIHFCLLYTLQYLCHSQVFFFFSVILWHTVFLLSWLVFFSSNASPDTHYLQLYLPFAIHWWIGNCLTSSDTLWRLSFFFLLLYLSDPISHLALFYSPTPATKHPCLQY